MIPKNLNENNLMLDLVGQHNLATDPDFIRWRYTELEFKLKNTANTELLDQIRDINVLALSEHHKRVLWIIIAISHTDINDELLLEIGHHLQLSGNDYLMAAVTLGNEPIVRKLISHYTASNTLKIKGETKQEKSRRVTRT